MFTFVGEIPERGVLPGPCQPFLCHGTQRKFSFLAPCGPNTGIGKFFCKRQDSKYLWLWGPRCHCSLKSASDNREVGGYDCDPIKSDLQKQVLE